MMPVRTRLYFLLASLLTVGPAAVTQEPAKSAFDFDKLIKDKRYLELEAALKMPEAEKMIKAERDYFAGIIANRRNRLEESIALLKPLVDMSAAPPADSAPAVSPLTREQQKNALRALGDSYTKSFRYPEAAAAYEQAERRFTNVTTDEERHELRLEKEFRDLLRQHPAQTVSVESPFTVQGRRSKIGLLEIAVDIPRAVLTTEDMEERRGHAAAKTSGDSVGVDQRKSAARQLGEWWIVDTGANFSTISRSTAEKLGLQLSDGATHVKGITGDESKLNLAIIPELRIGKATLRNVAVLVLDDKNLYISQIKYQIHGIIGAPVLMALQRITFFGDDRFGVGLPATNDPSTAPNMMMDELTPLVEASTYESRKPLLFSFDTGANQSAFYARYYQERKAEFVKAKLGKRGYGGAGGFKIAQAYKLERVPMEICGGRATLPKVDVMIEPSKKTEPEFYGNLGQDVVTPFRSFTLDFGTMRCSAE